MRDTSPFSSPITISLTLFSEEVGIIGKSFIHNIVPLDVVTGISSYIIEGINTYIYYILCCLNIIIKIKISNFKFQNLIYIYINVNILLFNLFN